MEKEKKRKTIRKKLDILPYILLCFLILSMVLSAFLGMLYKKSNNLISILETENQEMDEKYNNLVNEMENEGYITIEEANEMSAQAAESASKSKVDEYLEFIKNNFESGEGSLTLLEELFPNHIIVPVDSNYKFVDLNKNLNMKNWVREGFDYPEKDKETGKYPNTRLSYVHDGKEARFGIDISKFQGDIDWQKVKNDDVDYCIMRLGYRGYEEGNLYLDTKYEDNIKGCSEAGIDCSVYFFTEAINKNEAIEEAEFVLENIEGYDIKLPIVIDVELSANPAKARTKDLTSKERTDIVIAFCERIKEAGYTPMIYGNLRSMLIMMDFEMLEDYDKWFAYYRYPIRFPYKIKMWQYTSTGKINGISGDVDCNLMFY